MVETGIDLYVKGSNQQVASEDEVVLAQVAGRSIGDESPIDLQGECFRLTVHGGKI
jgi:hypothetical protein